MDYRLQIINFVYSFLCNLHLRYMLNIPTAETRHKEGTQEPWNQEMRYFSSANDWMGCHTLRLRTMSATRRGLCNLLDRVIDPRSGVTPLRLSAGVP